MKDFIEVFLDLFKNLLINRKFNFNTEITEDNEFLFNINNEDGTFILYKIVYDSNSLKLINDEKILSTWFFNENNTKKENESIANDFLEIISKKKIQTNKNSLSQDEEISQKSDDINIYGFVEKLCSFLPEIKNEFNSLKSNSNFNNTLDFINFINRFINPKINEILTKGKNKNTIEKIFSYLCKSYINGDENIKCIISMAIFNNITGKEQRNLAKSFLAGPMIKVWDASYMFKK